jgi:hypothetical protein
MIEAASGRSRISADPASPLTDLLHRAAHVDVDDRRAALLVELGRLGHFMGLQPASCSDTGSSLGSQAAFCSDWRVSRIIAWLAIISLTVSPRRSA